MGDNSEDIVWRTGIILFEEIGEKIKISENDPISIVKLLAKYLKKVGYLKDAKIVPINEAEFEYWMKDPAIEIGAFKLMEEGFMPPHISTSLLFAALKKLTDKELELQGAPIRKKGWIVEKWKVKKVSSPQS